MVAAVEIRQTLQRLACASQASAQEKNKTTR